MASKKSDPTAVSNKTYQPKATVRHAKIAKTKQDEIDAMKERIETNKYLAKKAESKRKAEIKKLPKEERAEAKAELKNQIEKRKNAEKAEKEKLNRLICEDKEEKRVAAKEKESTKSEKTAEPVAVPAPETEEKAVAEDIVTEDAVAEDATAEEESKKD